MTRIMLGVSTTLTSLVLLTACSQNNGPSSIGLNATRSAGARVASRPTAGPTIYANTSNGNRISVDVFSNGGKTFLRRIKNGGNLVADQAGYLYIAHQGRSSGYVAVYSDQGKTLVQNLTMKDGPWDNVLAAD